MPNNSASLNTEEIVVLLVDDDDLVRRVLRRQLDGKGLIILEAESGEQAIDILKHHSPTVDLLITDVMMPDMTGPELARRWTSEVPETQVLFMSGFPETALVGNELLASGRADFLRKPFSARSLIDKVTMMLLSPLGESCNAF